MTDGAAAARALLLATMDLDDFKSINDKHGHAAGDAALCAFAAAARSLLRPQDCLGRIGGDEFALIMPLRSLKDGRTTAERLHRDLSVLLETADHSVTISMGALVVAKGTGLDRLALMREVDRAMYQAEARGKGGVETRIVLPADRMELGLRPASTAA